MKQVKLYMSAFGGVPESMEIILRVELHLTAIERESFVQEP
jgi:hypothetical protein